MQNTRKPFEQKQMKMLFLTDVKTEEDVADAVSVLPPSPDVGSLIVADGSVTISLVGGALILALPSPW